MNIPILGLTTWPPLMSCAGGEDVGGAWSWNQLLGQWWQCRVALLLEDQHFVVATTVYKWRHETHCRRFPKVRVMVIWPRRINSVGFKVVALDVLHYRYTVDDLGVTPLQRPKGSIHIAMRKYPLSRTLASACTTLAPKYPGIDTGWARDILPNYCNPVTKYQMLMYNNIW